MPRDSTVALDSFPMCLAFFLNLSNMDSRAWAELPPDIILHGVIIIVNVKRIPEAAGGHENWPLCSFTDCPSHRKMTGCVTEMWPQRKWY